MECGITDQPGPARDSPCTEIEYTLDLEDHIACRISLSRAAGPSSPRIRPLRPSDCFLMLAVMLVIAGLLWVVHADVSLFVAAVLGALVALLLGVILVRHDGSEPPRDQPASDQLLAAREEVQKLQALGVIRVGRRDRVTLDSDGFTEINDFREDGKAFMLTERRETRVCWSEVASIMVFDQHAIVMVAGRGCLFVPKRAFPAATAFDQFLKHWRGLWESFRMRTRDEITLGPVQPPPDGRLQPPQ